MIKLWKRYKKWRRTKILDNKFVRLICLGICAALGFAFWCFALSDNCNLCETFEGDWLAPITAIKAEEHAARFAHPFALSFFVLLALWYFRTRDTLRQIANADAQLQQSNFTIGLTNLVISKSINIDTGVAILLQVSSETDVFDTQIRIAFIRRLKDIPLTSKNVHIGTLRRPGNHLSYAQHMLKWLIEYQEKNPSSIKPDLSGMNCDHQEFTSTGIGNSRFSKILPSKDDGADALGRADEYNPITFAFTKGIENLDFKDVLREVVAEKYRRQIFGDDDE